MTVDGLQIENKVSGDFYTLDTHGAYFIGKHGFFNDIISCFVVFFVFVFFQLKSYEL